MTCALAIDTAIDACLRAKKATDFRFPLLLVSGSAEKSITVLANDADNPAAHAVKAAREDVRAKAVALDTYVIAYDGLCLNDHPRPALLA
jgi:hypothetical protein